MRGYLGKSRGLFLQGCGTLRLLVELVHDLKRHLIVSFLHVIVSVFRGIDCYKVLRKLCERSNSRGGILVSRGRKLEKRLGITYRTCVRSFGKSNCDHRRCDQRHKNYCQKDFFQVFHAFLLK